MVIDNSKISVTRVFIKNRAPFENMDLAFNENEIAVLTAVNGRGKTTILSYIVDAWHEIARPNFKNEFEGKENKYYRVSSQIFNININEPSFVYIRFKVQEEYIDYVDIRNICTQLQYDEIILEDKIPFNEIKNDLERNNYIKKVSKSLDEKKVERIFRTNVITYFPSYRYETPGYLNEPYNIHLDFTKKSLFSGYLPNPIEVVTGLPQLANWMMDVALDMLNYQQTQNIQFPDGHIRTIDITKERHTMWNSLNLIISQTLSTKKHFDSLHFGINKRNVGSSRISIMNDRNDMGEQKPEQIYPTIFNLSSGEAAILCIFGEILRQADKLSNNISFNFITGIVLIDEIDKHLHIKLQKEVLPLLLNLFPNVQFIVSSHTPFLNMGLAENKISNARTTIIDLDQNGIKIPLQENPIYQEVYQMMMSYL